MQLMYSDWWFAFTLLCWRGSFCFLCSKAKKKAIVSRIPTGGLYLWLHQIQKNSLKEGKKLASLLASLFSIDSVRFSVQGCRSPLLCPDLLRQKSGSHQQSVWSLCDSHPADRYAALLWGSEGNCVGSKNNGSLGRTLRWSLFIGLQWGKLNKPASRSDIGWNKHDSTHFYTGVRLRHGTKTYSLD